MRFLLTAFNPLARAGAIILAAAICICSANGHSADRRSAGTSDGRTGNRNVRPLYKVTPVIGYSWLKLIGVFDIRNSPMGEMGGDGPPPPSDRIEPEFPVGGAPPEGGMGMGMGGMMGRGYAGPRYSRSEIESMLDQRFSLAGVDFYRLDCRSCHGPDGNGAPPIINSIIGPFKGTAPALIEERMKKLGRPIGAKMAKELADQAQQSIVQRLQKGGKMMPPFRHLAGEEVTALIHYLKGYVGDPESQGNEILVTESTARVGEHLVKGTCHICHDATGPGMRDGGMMRGIIPSLASFPWEQSMQSVVRQVELGSRNMMMMRGPRMPAYPYITPDEAASAYLYLLGYPP
jgi:mono/diheme cytochrome c family protein